eukprot:CAMPEP_0176505492 /NCGR_PEP_ID=MMETSP0200_2-20121128/16527_1 /TAXON_ID=947934 /ORGANISM="Chaetoceros sp., Strain GSL56" /LENGTH=660 /DNA_ID=CAMNT_0017905057 /DNA_START=100 /DNA_END=2083 /DNA_ORIENTATION=-
MPAAPPAAPFRASYVDFFADATKDPFQGQYAAAMAPYDVPLQNNPGTLAPDQLRTLVVGARAQRVPTAFLLMHDGHLHIYLQADKFHPRLGLPATPWDDFIYAQKGDLYRNQAVLIEWKSDYFHQLNQQLLVPSAATIDTVFAAEPDTGFLGPYAQGEAGTELIKVRRTCFVPPRYVNLFLAGPVKPREAWERVRGQIVTEGQEVACHALVKYLQAALTLTVAGAAPALSLADTPVAPLADSLLLDHRQRILEEDFPQLNHQLAGIQQNQIAASLGELVRDNRVARELERADRDKAKEKDPQEMLGEVGLQKIIRWSHVETSVELQAIWKDLAKAKKSQQLAVLQWAVDKAKDELGDTELQFIVSPAHLEMVKNLRFTMLTPNHVATGLQPFQFPEEALDGSLNAQAIYEALYAGTSAPPMADLATVMQSKPGAPRALFQARHQVRRVYVLLVVTLGEEHRLVLAYERFYHRFLSAEAELHRYQQGLPSIRDQLLFPIKLLKRNAIDLSYWFDQQAHTPAARMPPKFEQVFDDIKQELTVWEPQMSVGFLKELKLDALGEAATPVPSIAPTASPYTAPKAPADDATASNPHFLEATFGKYRKLTSVKTRDIRRKITAGGLPALPVSKVDQQPIAWHGTPKANAMSVVPELRTMCPTPSVN